VLDNSLRESTVGQLRGHTIENKWAIYNEVLLHIYRAICINRHHLSDIGDHIEYIGPL